MKKHILHLIICAALIPLGASRAAETVPLTQLDLSHLHYEGWARPKTDQSFNGKPLSIGGQKFERGIGTRALSTLWLELDGRTEKFLAAVGVDDAAGNAWQRSCSASLATARNFGSRA